MDWTHPTSSEDFIQPRLWSTYRKWTATTMVSLYTFLASISSSIIAPALPLIGHELNIDSEALRIFTLSIYYLGFVLGALPYGPLSEIFGRNRVLQISWALYLVFNIACGFASTTSQLLLFRLISGFGGSASIAVCTTALPAIRITILTHDKSRSVLE